MISKENCFFIGRLSDGVEVYRQPYTFKVIFSEKVGEVDLAELERLIRPDPQITVGPIITLKGDQ